MRTLEAMLQAVRREAERGGFPIDERAYERAERDPHDPILFAGAFDAPFCSIGRDLGIDEVLAGEPQIGAAGRQVRAGLYRAATGEEPPAADRRLEPALRLGLLTNTVPYKPPGNRAYPDRIRERFRPFLAELLLVHWTGGTVLTLGTEAFRWFTPYAPDGALDAFWSREDRYEADLPLDMEATIDGKRLRKAIILAPLPHPSPLNVRWYRLFPDLLARRLKA
jgi:uracil-DNA glycosylase